MDGLPALSANWAAEPESRLTGTTGGGTSGSSHMPLEEDIAIESLSEVSDDDEQESGMDVTPGPSMFAPVSTRGPPQIPSAALAATVQRELQGQDEQGGSTLGMDGQSQLDGYGDESAFDYMEDEEDDQVDVLLFGDAFAGGFDMQQAAAAAEAAAVQGAAFGEALATSKPQPSPELAATAGAIPARTIDGKHPDQQQILIPGQPPAPFIQPPTLSTFTDQLLPHVRSILPPSIAPSRPGPLSDAGGRPAGVPIVGQVPQPPPIEGLPPVEPQAAVTPVDSDGLYLVYESPPAGVQLRTSSDPAETTPPIHRRIRLPTGPGAAQLLQATQQQAGRRGGDSSTRGEARGGQQADIGEWFNYQMDDQSFKTLIRDEIARRVQRTQVRQIQVDDD